MKGISGEEAEAGFTVACGAGFSEPAGTPREEAIARAEGGIERVLVTSRNAMANRLPVLLIIDLGARNISLCLLNLILGKDAFRLKLGCWC